MHVGWLSHLDLPAGVQSLDVGRLTASIAARLHRAPRFRQRLAPRPLGMGEPEWVDDPRFQLDRHITVARDTALGLRELRRLTDAFMSSPLPRHRPLWSLLRAADAGRRAAVTLAGDALRPAGVRF